jgi:microsomal dipeptidase-like Zn-dependent dipeptidase
MAVLDFEGGWDLDGDLGSAADLYRLGLRSSQLPRITGPTTMLDRCGSAQMARAERCGRAVVKEMNRLGMVINVSTAR